ncbi:MAG: DUF2225 domain-containing protein [Elusimicrobia bacterium]|nr:DUF2225 domain-containing protein [Elusimicrobiota bacterium]
MKKILIFLAICFLMVSCSSKQVELSNYDKGIEAAKNAQYEQAIEFFNNALNEENKNETKASILYNIGFCYGIMKNMEKEVEYYNKALDVFSDFQPALYDLGEYYYNNNDLNNALKMYEKLVAVNPEHEGAYYMIALIQNDLGNKEESMKNMQKAADLDSPDAKKFLGEITPAE